MKNPGSRRKANILYTRHTNTRSPSYDGKRYSYADGQDIGSESAHSGQPTGHQARKRKRPGPKRKHPRDKENWMPNRHGRIPYKGQLDEYLKKTDRYYEPLTRKERNRKFNLIGKTIVELGALPNIYKWTKDDIHRWITHIDDRIQNSTQVKYWRYLEEVLDYYRNDCLKEMLRDREIRRPRVPPKEVRSLTEEDVIAVNEATNGIGGWDGTVAKFVTIMYPYTGLRPSELRTQKLSEVYIQQWTLRVSNPKGSKQYGRKRTVPIPAPTRGPLQEFLQARETYLQDLGEEVNVDILIPYRSRQGITFWPETRWRALKGMISRRTHVEFTWKDFRSTYCQWLIDRGATLQSVSKIMGHSTTRTTELHYGRIKDSRAIEEINRVLSEPVIPRQELTYEFSG